MKERGGLSYKGQGKSVALSLEEQKAGKSQEEGKSGEYNLAAVDR